MDEKSCVKSSDEGSSDSTLSPTEVNGKELDAFYWNKKTYTISVLQTILFLYCYLGIGFLNSMSGPLMNHLEETTGVSFGQMSWILTTKGFGMVTGTIVSGWIYNAFKKFDNQKFKWWNLNLNRVLLIVLVLMTVSLILVPFAKNYFFMLFVFFCQGFFSGSVENGGNLGIAWIWREKVGPFMQALHCSYSVGGFVFPLIVAQIFTYVQSSFIQLVLSYSICGALILFAAIPLLVVPCPKVKPKPKEGEGEEKESEEKEEEKPDDDKGKGKEMKKKIKKFILKDFLGYSTLIYALSGVLKGLTTGGYSVFGVLVFKYCYSKRLGSNVQMTYLTTFFWSSFALGRLLGIFLISILPTFIFLAFSVANTIIAYVLIIYFANEQTTWGVWIAVAVHGLSAAPISALAMALPQVSFKVPLNAASTSIVALGSTMGEMIVPAVISALIPVLGVDSIVYVLICIYSFALIDVVLVFVVGKVKRWLDASKKKKKHSSLSDSEREDIDNIPMKNSSDYEVISNKEEDTLKSEEH